MKWFGLLLLFYLSVNANAQDWIVIKSGDTIYCHILSVNEINIQYKTTSSEPPRSIAQEIVESYRRAELEYFPSRILSDKDYTKLKKVLRIDKKGLRFGFGLGYTYRLASAPEGSSPAIQEHIKKMKSGFNLKADVIYFFGKYFGLGAKYTYSNFRAETDRVSGYTPLGTPYFGTISDNIRLHFIGLHPTARFGSSNGAARFLLGITMGYLAVTNNSKVGFPFTLKGSAFCFSADMSLEIKLIPRLYIALGVELAGATISKYDYDDGFRQGTLTFDRKNQDNLFRFDFNGGLRFYL
jgi:hypothetical protein